MLLPQLLNYTKTSEVLLIGHQHFSKRFKIEDLGRLAIQQNESNDRNSRRDVHY